jgi:hypothetical protein
MMNIEMMGRNCATLLVEIPNLIFEVGMEEDAFEEGEIVEEGQRTEEPERKLAEGSSNNLPSWLKGNPPKRKRSYSSSSPPPPPKQTFHSYDAARQSQRRSPSWLSGSFKNRNLSTSIHDRKNSSGVEASDCSSGGLVVEFNHGGISPPPPPPPPSEVPFSSPSPPPPPQSPPPGVPCTTNVSSHSSYSLAMSHRSEESLASEQSRLSPYLESSENTSKGFPKSESYSVSEEHDGAVHGGSSSQTGEKTYCSHETSVTTYERDEDQDVARDDFDLWDYTELVRDTIQNGSSRVPSLRTFLDSLGTEKYFNFLKDLEEKQNQRLISLERESKSSLELELAEEQVEKKQFECFLQHIRLERLEKNVIFIENEWSSGLISMQ